MQSNNISVIYLPQRYHYNKQHLNNGKLLKTKKPKTKMKQKHRVSTKTRNKHTQRITKDNNKN